MAGKVERKGIMEPICFNCNDVWKQMRKIKTKKAAGPDNIKPDLIKILMNSQICIDSIVTMLNEIITGEMEIPSTWRDSNLKVLSNLSRRNQSQQTNRLRFRS